MVGVRGRLAALSLFVATLAFAWSGAPAAAPSDVDPAFGNGTGFVVSPFSGGHDDGNFVLPRSDGTIVVVATSRPSGGTARPLVIRYLSSGQPDLAFGTGGFAQFVQGGQDYIPVAAALDALGRIYVLAQGPQVVDASSTGGPLNYRLLRIDESGTADPGFGNNGVVQFNPSEYSISSPVFHPRVLLLRGMTATSDGGVALAGSYDYQQFANCCYLAHALVIRLNQDGTFNGNFGSSGVLRFAAGGANNVEFRSLLAVAAGKLVLAGYRQATNGGPKVPIVAQFDASGSADPSFGVDGIKEVPGLASTEFARVASRPSGRLVAATNGNGNAIDIVAFDAAGAPDPGFGANGIARIDTATPTVNGLISQVNGKVLVLARLPADANPGDYLFRYTESGALDAGFATNGKLRTNRMLGVALQADGRIVGAGGTTAYTANPGSVFVARYLGDPPSSGGGVANTYRYTGTLFNTLQNFTPPCSRAPCGTYTAAMRVTGELSVATPLAPNLVNQDIAAAITAFSFSDGVQTLTAADSYRSATVSTDSQGNITAASLSLTRFTAGTPFTAGAWYDRIRIGPPANGGGSLGSINVQCGGASCTDAVTNLNAFSIGASNVPGTWTTATGGGAPVNLNQRGVTGSWYQPATSGQGVELDVAPDLIAAGTGYVFGSWFTFDHVATGGANRQRWYSFDGEMKTGEARSAITIYSNVGGNFAALPPTTSTIVGTGALELSDCSSAQLSYAFSDGSGRAGTIPLVRLTESVTCTPSGGAAGNEFFAWSGNWYAPATSGQGITIEVNPLTPIAFMTWYTYAPNGQGDGASGQRWYSGESAQTPFTPGQRAFALTLYETVGGLFDAATTPGPVTSAVGTATITFLGCTTAELAYGFTSGSNAGRQGTIALSRLGPVPAGCVP